MIFTTYVELYACMHVDMYVYIYMKRKAMIYTTYTSNCQIPNHEIGTAHFAMDVFPSLLASGKRGSLPKFHWIIGRFIRFLDTIAHLLNRSTSRMFCGRKKFPLQQSRLTFSFASWVWVPPPGESWRSRESAENYPLVNIQKTSGKSTLLIDKSTIDGPCSIANC